MKAFCTGAAALLTALSIGAAALAQTGMSAVGGFAGATAGTAASTSLNAAAPGTGAANVSISPTTKQLIGTSNATDPAPSSAKAAPDAPATGAALIRPPQRVSGPNQFQRFVQETTGRLLPVYGRDLFDSPQSYAANSHESRPTPRMMKET